MAWNVSMIPYEVRRALRGSDGLLSPLFDATGLALDYAKVHRLAPTGPLTILLDVINQGYSDIGADLNPEQRAGRIAIAVVEGWATGEFASAVGFATAPFGVATVTLAAPEAGPASMAVGYVGGYAVGAIPAMYAANSMFDELNREMVYPFLGLGPP